MGIRSAKDTIKDARLKSELTQEQMSAGICSVQALSKIENGVIGVSPSTFQALMDRAGAPCERYPIFANKTDFECFYALKHVKFHLDAWQLQPAYDELQKVEEMQWANNKFYYQEWLLFHSLLQFKSYSCDHKTNYDILMTALHITHPQIVLTDFQNLLLSRNELMILIALSQEVLYLHDNNSFMCIYNQIICCLKDCHYDYLEVDRLKAELAVPYCKHLIDQHQYQEALEEANLHRHKMAINSETGILLELTFICGLCNYYLNNLDTARKLISASFYSAHAIDSCYSTVCKQYLKKNTSFQISKYMNEMTDIVIRPYNIPTITLALFLGDGTYDIFSKDVYTLGSIIKDARTSQHISQQTLCYGVCSKPTISKIENGSLQPDIALAEVLLQRLGISERIFTFWGNEKESKFYNLKFKLIHGVHYVSSERYTEYLNKMHELISDSDQLYQQQLLSTMLSYRFKDYDVMPELMDVLKITHPDFDIHHISRYRFSWEELSIFNIIGDCYRLYNYSDSESYYFFHELLYYTQHNNFDSIFRASYFHLFFNIYLHFLFSQKNYKEILQAHTKYNNLLAKHNLKSYGYYSFYYCQALQECMNYESAYRYAIYSCNIQTLYELSANSEVLKKGFQSDYHVTLEF